MSTIFIKKIKNFLLNPWSDLSKSDAFNLEKQCIKTLNKNFRCICKTKHIHFPKLLRYNKLKYELCLTYCGESIYDIRQNKQNKKIINIVDIKEQIDCIIYNLKKSKIKHLDIHPSGKNICIFNNNIILIDFDISSINNIYLSQKIIDRHKTYKNLYYITIKKQFLYILLGKLNKSSITFKKLFP